MKTELISLLKAGAGTWNAWRASNLDEDIDLSEADLRGLVIDNAVLVGANLNGADFSGGRFTATDLSSARCIGTIFRDIGMIDTDLSKGCFTGADFTKSRLKEMVFAGADLRGADLSGATIQGSSLRGCRLDGAIVKDIDIRTTEIGDAPMSVKVAYVRKQARNVVSRYLDPKSGLLLKIEE